MHTEYRNFTSSQSKSHVKVNLVLYISHTRKNRQYIQHILRKKKHVVLLLLDFANGLNFAEIKDETT